MIIFKINKLNCRFLCFEMETIILVKITEVSLTLLIYNKKWIKIRFTINKVVICSIIAQLLVKWGRGGGKIIVKILLTR